MRYRLLGFISGFTVVAMLIWLLRGGPVATMQPVLPEGAGALRTVEIQYTRTAAPTTWPILSAFFDAIAPDVEVIAACGDTSDAKAIARSWRWRNRLVTVIVGAEITGWSKDRFLVGAGRPASLYRPNLEPTPLQTRNNDSLVCEALAAQLPLRFQVRGSELAFDAGDIVCTRDAAIFSDVLWRKNGERKDLAERVANLAGNKPLWLKGVPAHHIGMFAAPVDARVVMVGDPDLGKRLWTPAATARLGKPDFSQPTTEPFREAARQFEAAGYRVVAVPECQIEPQVYTTYTNGVFETRGNRRIVYMPVYGVKSMDDAAKTAYQHEGWEVRPIPVERVFRLHGTIGCLVNVLERA